MSGKFKDVRKILPQKDSELFGQDSGPFPRHHFILPKSLIPTGNQALQIRFAGPDEYVRGVWRTRKRSETFAMEYVQKGLFEFIQNGKRYECGPGSMYIVQLGGDSTMRCLSEYAYKKTVSLTGTALPVLLNSLNLAETDVILHVPSEIDDLFESVFALLKETPPNYLQELSVLSWRILLELSGTSAGQNYPEELVRIIRCIEENFDKELTIEWLSRKSGVSPRNVFRLFRKYLKETPIEYVIRRRMYLARCLLLEGHRTIKDISWNVGYRNPLYFSSEFHRMFGVSPREFRKVNWDVQSGKA